MSARITERIRGAIASLAFFAAVATLPACAPAVQPVGSATEQPAGDALPLWEVRGPVGSAYLLGSIHLLHPDVYPLEAPIYDAFDAADLVAFELDFTEMMENLQVMAERGRLPEGRTLRDVLPADLFAELERRAEMVGMPIQMVEGMKPWMAGLTLSSLVLQQAGYEAGAGVDMHFHARASEAGMRVIGLETLEEQLDVFDGLDRDAQIALLRASLDQMDTAVAELDRATEYWRRGDAERLADMFVESMGDQPDLLERLLYERNRKWIPQIEALMAAPARAIVIVGMGHLIGEHSVIDMLEQRGHEVRQLRSTQARPAVRP